MRIIVTGANRGIGKGLVEAFATRSAVATGTARHPGGRQIPIDVTDPTPCRRWHRR